MKIIQFFYDDQNLLTFDEMEESCNTIGASLMNIEDYYEGDKEFFVQLAHMGVPAFLLEMVAMKSEPCASVIQKI